jgi:pimeloyl-ACP methyl ester carboxylesterase
MPASITAATPGPSRGPACEWVCGSCRGGAAVLQVRPRHNGGVSIPPETRYARNGAIHLAYQVLGSGPPNLLVVGPGLNSHVDYAWMEPSLARSMRRLASFSRLIVYDNRGVGLSDPVPGGAAPAMDEQVDDIRAILDETGCQRAVLAGNLAGCALALVFAATHPGRVESLVLLGGYARLRAGAGYPQGLDRAHVDQIADAVLGSWGTGRTWTWSPRRWRPMMTSAAGTRRFSACRPARPRRWR